MSKISKDSIFSPLAIFIIYVLSSALVIMGFRFIFPGENAPLAYFSTSWRISRFLLDYIKLCPALIFAALVIPFGFQVKPQEESEAFSGKFLQIIKPSITTAITASVIYALLSFLVLPLAQDYEADFRYKGQLFHLAKERAQEHADKGEWEEAAQFVAVCETIWPKSPEMARLKTESDIRVQADRITPEPAPAARQEAAPVSMQPVTVTEALELAEKALTEERYFDAHWLATLGGRLASPNSVEQATATRLAGLAWDKINSLAPSSREERIYSIYRLKREAFEAFVSDQWIRAYYIFQQLLDLNPEDPDVIKYSALSEVEVKKAAFFIDEIETTSGAMLTGAVFSLPMGSGRMVIRLGSLTSLSDSAYCINVDIMTFDRDGRPLWSMEAPYAKILPLDLESDPTVVLLMRAIDRQDQNKHWEPVTRSLGQRVPDTAQISLSITWDNFLLLSKVRRGLSSLSPVELMTAAKTFADYGYLSQVFEAELIRRFTEPLFLLPLSILAIVIGWRYRAMQRPRYMGVPMLCILPLVFNGVAHFCWGWINDFGILAVVSFGFTTAALCLGIGIVVLFILSLIILAAQHT